MKYLTPVLLAFMVSTVTAYLFLGGAEAAFAVAVLSILEVSLSLDNAVVNAKQLNLMSEVFRKRFLTWGMVVAVFGMRVAFPVLIVSVVSGINPVAALNLALFKPAEYAATLMSAHFSITGFGMAFLSMVFLKYFFDKEKEVHWIGFIEKHLHHLQATEVACTAIALASVAVLLPKADALSFVMAGLVGVASYEVVEWLSSKLGDEGGSSAVANLGWGAFIYLEVLDASFSFDGVIGAFAITTNFLIIALGLGTGAFAVRSLTLMLVEKGTLAEFRFLESGAFYAIGALVVFMGISTFHEVPEVVTGLTGAALIGAALISSIIWRKQNES